MTHTVTPEVERYVAFLWDLAEGEPDPHDVCMLRRIAGTLERLDRENRELRGRGIKTQVAA